MLYKGVCSSHMTLQLSTDNVGQNRSLVLSQFLSDKDFFSIATGLRTKGFYSTPIFNISDCASDLVEHQKQ